MVRTILLYWIQIIKRMLMFHELTLLDDETAFGMITQLGYIQIVKIIA